MPRPSDAEIISSLQTQVSHLRMQLCTAEELFPADIKAALAKEMKANADAVIQEFEALRAKVVELEGENARLKAEQVILREQVRDLRAESGR